LTLPLLFPCQGAEPGNSVDHQAAVEAARSNDLGRAWGLIQEARKQRPEDPLVMQDYLAIGAWSGHGVEVLSAARSMDLKALRRYVLEALGRAAREAKDFGFSRACYEEVLRREPDRQEARLGLAWAAMATSRFQEARNILDGVPSPRLKEAPFGELRATLAEAQQDWAGLLAASEDVLALQPTHSAALRWRFQALRRLGLPDRALELTPQTLLTDDEKTAVQRDALGVQQTRLAAQSDPLERQRQSRSLEERYRERLGHLPSGLHRDIQMGLIQDYLGLLSSQASYAEVLSEANRWIQPPLLGTASIHLMLGEAWLHLGHPSRALTEFDAALTLRPGDTDAELGRFWALLDQGRWREARAAASASLKRQTAPREGAVWSTTYLDAVRREAQALGYTDALQEAESKLEALQKRAPADDSTLESLALVWRFRGEPRRAAELLTASAQRNPERGWTWISLAAAQREAGDFTGESQSLARAACLMPGTTGLGDAQKESSLARGAAFSLEGAEGQSQDVAPNAPTGSRDQVYRLRMESPLMADAWRVRGDVQREETRIQERELQRDRLAMSMAYVNELWRGEVSVGTQNQGAQAMTGRKDQTTAQFRAQWTPGDAWGVEANYAHNSEDVPLRAWDAGVHGNLVGLSVSYRWQEVGALRSGYSRLSLNDGNQRDSAWLSGERRLVSWGPHTVTGSAGLWLSQNSLAPAMATYFNPVHDRSLNLDLSYLGPLWQEGTSRLRHQIQVSAGRYEQSGQTGRGVFIAGYSLLLNLGRGIEGHVGVRYAERPYDGVINRGTEIRFGLAGRLR